MQDVGEVASVQALHREERDGRLLVADLHHLHDVVALERRDNPCLAHEPCDVVAVDEEVPVQHLHGGDLPGAVAARFVDLAHSAAADERSERERAQRLIGVPPGAADLERAREIGASFEEQGLTHRGFAQPSPRGA